MEKKKIDPTLEAIQVEKPTPLYKDFLIVGILLTGLLIACAGILEYIGQPVEVRGESMYSTLGHGDIILVNKLTYRIGKPQRFDIVVFEALDESVSEENCVKRVIGLPGETVQIVDGTILVDNIVLDEDYGYEEINNANNAKDPIKLGEGEYFVLGDNRNNSIDSRYDAIGLVREEQIKGKAFLRIFPLSKINRVS